MHHMMSTMVNGLTEMLLETSITKIPTSQQCSQERTVCGKTSGGSQSTS